MEYVCVPRGDRFSAFVRCVFCRSASLLYRFSIFSELLLLRMYSFNELDLYLFWFRNIWVSLLGSFYENFFYVSYELLYTVLVFENRTDG